MGERRETKKRETRQRISDVATALFFERGFDAVTLDEIAAAAKVSKMTVINYFARKEELMLDREDDLTLLPLRRAIAERARGQSPMDAVRAVLKQMGDQDHPLIHVEKPTLAWWRVVSDSPSLEARLRELADVAADGLATALAAPKPPDGLSRLAAGVIVAAMRTARQESLRFLERGASEKKANAAFHELMDQGLAAAEYLLAARH